MRFNTRNAIVTGAASGLGLGIARYLAAQGVRVCAADVNSDQLKEILPTISPAPHGAPIMVGGDLSVRDDARELIQTAIAEFGVVDILVNNAGGGVIRPTLEHTEETLRATMDRNLWTMIYCTLEVLPHMIERRYGKIINVGGTFGMHGKAGRMSYSASKWGLRGITKSFAIEAGPHNVNVNYVAPGMVDGPRFRDKVCADMARRLNITPEQAAERHAADYALRRITQDQDVANACLFFASDVSRQITGADLPVDGGWAML